jgi:hypothetical protein
MKFQDWAMAEMQTAREFVRYGCFRHVFYPSGKPEHCRAFVVKGSQ